MPLRAVPFWATCLLLVITALTVGVTLKAKERTQTLVSFPGTGVIASTDNATFEVIAPEAWPYATQAETAIRTLQADQYVQFGILKDPTTTSASYFSAVAFDQETEEVTLSIYRYHQFNGLFERLYKATYAQGAHPDLHSTSWPVVHIVGYDDGNLIVLVKDGEEEIPDCQSPLVYGVNEEKHAIARLFSLDLTDLSSGLTPYVPSDEVVMAAREQEASCSNTASP